ncbi:MAG: Radical domain protein [Bacteroidota bacterium]|nr:Radical domain protein [Bacteroidota bacterium]
MLYVATALLFDKEGRLLIYLRDDKPGISFPNHWDLFGGIIEEGETPEQALVREIQEELGITISRYGKFGEYESSDIEKPNRKYVYYAKVDFSPYELKLGEGQRLTSIHLEDRYQYKFANILANIIEDFANQKGTFLKLET